MYLNLKSRKIVKNLEVQSFSQSKDSQFDLNLIVKESNLKHNIDMDKELNIVQ